MNVDHTKLYIPIECNGQKYHITVQIENPGHEDPVYIATGPFHKDLAVSPAGFGMGMIEAVQDLISQYEGHRIYTEKLNL